MKKNTQHSEVNEPGPDYLRARNLARKYQVSERHILLLAAAGKIPSIRVGTKCVRFSEAAVAKALEQASQASVAIPPEDSISTKAGA